MGAAEFAKREKRGSMYRVASHLLNEWWGKFPEMADALSVLLLTWNQAFYRYGSFDVGALEKSLEANWPTIDSYRSRDLLSFASTDHGQLRVLFDDMLAALSTKRGRSPVAVAKALHLLAPSFFPLWDDAIARAYKCTYARDPAGAYIRFCEEIRDIAKSLKPLPAGRSTKTLLKLIDEYNYAKYSKGWL